jgi:membrane protein
MMGIIRTFDKSIKEKHHGHFLHRRLKAIRITFILMILVLFSACFIYWQAAIEKFLLKNVFH